MRRGYRGVVSSPAWYVGHISDLVPPPSMRRMMEATLHSRRRERHPVTGTHYSTLTVRHTHTCVQEHTLGRHVSTATYQHALPGLSCSMFTGCTPLVTLYSACVSMYSNWVAYLLPTPSLSSPFSVMSNAGLFLSGIAVLRSENNMTDRQTDSPMNRQTDSPTNRQTDRQTDR